ncbi:MAG: hypothetical protein EOO45_14025 [Flavobacterium sp.]|nr:MAG: hypothetical protein EOO45_14025 [Flavobacterium sp.]
MGTLHDVYQLKPNALSSSAILKIRKNCEDAFLKCINLGERVAKETGIFSDTFLYISDDGKVERLAVYLPERIIDFKEPGIYLSIQSNVKWGFNDGFVKGIESAAPFMEDSLFFIIYDTKIDIFEIVNGKLHIEVRDDLDKWDYSFENYMLANYADSPQIFADYYMDKVTELSLSLEDMSANDADPGTYFELEEYEELLDKIVGFSEYIPDNELKVIKEWFKEKIAFQKDWEDLYYR